MNDEPEICDRCEHPWLPHVLIATLYSPIHGGLIFCQEVGCLCQTTWAIDGEPSPYIPDDEEVAELRALAQSDAVDESSGEWGLGDDREIRLE